MRRLAMTRHGVWLSVLAMLTGCMHDDAPVTASATAPTVSPAAQLQPAPANPTATTALRLDAGDQLRVTVFGEDRLSGPLTVDSDGRIAMPLVGPVDVAGLTPKEAGDRVTRQLSGQLVQPRVTVAIIAWRPLYVTGEVERSGQYAWQPGLNLVSAMALAGGATRRASRDEILVQRGGRGPLVAMKLSPETPVFPGDLLKAPERFF